jgi:NTE family protein
LSRLEPVDTAGMSYYCIGYAVRGDRHRNRGIRVEWRKKIKLNWRKKIKLNWRKKKVVSLALQGGGAHGAFTWGVLERLLEEDRIAIEGVSGASAGAMNGVLLAYGLTEGGPDEARRLMSEFWDRVASAIRLSAVQPSLLDELAGAHGLEWSPGFQATEALSQVLSPYELNPSDLNPLREILLALVDFDRLRKDCPLKLFIAATHVRTGKLRIFQTHELTPEVLLASACLPRLHQAVKIDGEAYWDGGYTGNPPLFPLIWRCTHRDIVMVVLNPLSRPATPRSATAIRSREAELAFTAAFVREMGAIARVREELGKDWFSLGRLERRLKRMHFHMIEGEDLIGQLSPTSRLNTRLRFLTMLRDHGRTKTDEWLRANFARLGTESSVNLSELFG